VWLIGFQHLFSVSAVFHNLNILIYIAVWVFRFLSVSSVPNANKVIPTSDTYYQFRTAANLKQISVLLNALNAFLAWFKLIRYLSLVPQFALITGTLARSARSVVAFAAIFAIVVGGFSAAHLLAFGTKLASFKNLTTSTFSLLQSLLGDFDFREMRRAQWFLGPMLFVLFVALSVLVLLNLLIATVADAYAEMQEVLRNDPSKQRAGQRIYEHILESVGSVYGANALLSMMSSTWRRMQIRRTNLTLR